MTIFNLKMTFFSSFSPILILACTTLVINLFSILQTMWNYYRSWNNILIANSTHWKWVWRQVLSAKFNSMFVIEKYVFRHLQSARRPVHRRSDNSKYWITFWRGHDGYHHTDLWRLRIVWCENICPNVRNHFIRAVSSQIHRNIRNSNRCCFDERVGVFHLFENVNILSN